ncbi:MAG: permease, partial [Acidovorax sp.]|nr:permease [Acidovorax sp.]
MAQHQPPALPPEAPSAALTSYSTPTQPTQPLWAARSGVVLASYLLMACALLLVMWRGLLPGLLCVCLGFLLTRALTSWLTAGLRRLQGAKAAQRATPRAAQVVAAAVVMLMPLALLAAGLTHSRGYLVDAPQQYRELLT